MLLAGASPRMMECDGNPVREDSGRLQMIVLLCRDPILRDEVKVTGLRTILANGRVAPDGRTG